MWQMLFSGGWWDRIVSDVFLKMTHGTVALDLSQCLSHLWCVPPPHPELDHPSRLREEDYSLDHNRKTDVEEKICGMNVICKEPRNGFGIKLLYAGRRVEAHWSKTESQNESMQRRQVKWCKVKMKSWAVPRSWCLLRKSRSLRKACVSLSCCSPVRVWSRESSSCCFSGCWFRCSSQNNLKVWQTKA